MAACYRNWPRSRSLRDALTESAASREYILCGSPRVRSAHFQNKLIAYLTTYSVPLRTTSCTLVYKQFTRDDEAKSQFTANISC